MLQRKTPLRSKTRLKPIGRRGRRLAKGDKSVREAVHARGVCELKNLVPKVICVGPLQHHHKKKREHLDERHSEDNGVCVCLSHHNWITYHPADARKLGLIVDSKSRLL